MTLAEYDAKTTRLKCTATRARNKAKSMLTLTDKLAQSKVAKDAAVALQNHRLDRFNLVAV